MVKAIRTYIDIVELDPFYKQQMDDCIQNYFVLNKLIMQTIYVHIYLILQESTTSAYYWTND